MPFPPANIEEDFKNALLGLSCTSIEHPSDWYWQIIFGNENNVVFGIECPWRLLTNEGIAFADEDHAQKFGLPEPIDGPRRALEILGTSRVVTATVRKHTSDATITFDNDAQLEIFNNSSGYEGWSCTFDKLNVIALGGGELAIMGRA